MRRYVVCIALALPGCSHQSQDDESRVDVGFELQVDCEQGGRVEFRANKDEESINAGESDELDPTKLKGILK